MKFEKCIGSAFNNLNTIVLYKIGLVEDKNIKKKTNSV